MKGELRQICKNYGMTLTELGKRLGKSKQYMSELARGNIRLSYGMAVDIAMVFNTTPDALFLDNVSNDIGHDEGSASCEKSL